MNKKFFLNKSSQSMQHKINHGIESCLNDINILCSNLNFIIMVIKLREIQHELQISRIDYLTYNKNDNSEKKKQIKKIKNKSNYLHFYNQEAILNFKF
jgi:hypothetical protein